MSSVYALRPVDGGPIKIGYTSGPIETRFAVIQANSPLVLELFGSCDAPYWHELALHRMLVEHRLHGEWFQDSPEVLALLEDFFAGVTPEGVLLDAMTTRERAA